MFQNDLAVELNSSRYQTACSSCSVECTPILQKDAVEVNGAWTHWSKGFLTNTHCSGFPIDKVSLIKHLILHGVPQHSVLAYKRCGTILSCWASRFLSARCACWFPCVGTWTAARGTLMRNTSHTAPLFTGPLRSAVTKSDSKHGTGSITGRERNNSQGFA